MKISSCCVWYYRVYVPRYILGYHQRVCTMLVLNILMEGGLLLRFDVCPPPLRGAHRCRARSIVCRCADLPSSCQELKSVFSCHTSESIYCPPVFGHGCPAMFDSPDPLALLSRFCRNHPSSTRTPCGGSLRWCRGELAADPFRLARPPRWCKGMLRIAASHRLLGIAVMTGMSMEGSSVCFTPHRSDPPF